MSLALKFNQKKSLQKVVFNISHFCYFKIKSFTISQKLLEIYCTLIFFPAFFFFCAEYHCAIFTLSLSSFMQSHRNLIAEMGEIIFQDHLQVFITVNLFCITWRKDHRNLFPKLYFVILLHNTYCKDHTLLLFKGILLLVKQEL